MVSVQSSDWYEIIPGIHWNPTRHVLQQTKMYWLCWVVKYLTAKYSMWIGILGLFDVGDCYEEICKWASLYGGGEQFIHDGVIEDSAAADDDNGDGDGDLIADATMTRFLSLWWWWRWLKKKQESFPQDVWLNCFNNRASNNHMFHVHNESNTMLSQTKQCNLNSSGLLGKS